jgi:hypothetical protein
MLAASAFGIFLIPMLYVVFQTGRERVKARLGLGGARKTAPDVPSPAHPGEHG